MPSRVSRHAVHFSLAWAFASQIGVVEASYIQAEHSQTGNVIKGFDNYLFSKEALRKRARQSERKEDIPKPLFSLSSKSSAVSREENSMMDVTDAR